MIRECFVEEKLFDKEYHIRIHIIELCSEVKGGWYQSMVSLQAFENRLLNRWLSAWYLKKKKGVGSYTNPRFSRIDKWERDIGRNRTLETIRHKSLKDFYNFIHYDPKRGKRLTYLDRFIGGI